jgi:hypothetical protein
MSHDPFMSHEFHRPGTSRFLFQRVCERVRLKAISIGGDRFSSTDFIRRAIGPSESSQVAGARQIKSSTLSGPSLPEPTPILDYQTPVSERPQPIKAWRPWPLPIRLAVLAVCLVFLVWRLSVAWGKDDLNSIGMVWQWGLVALCLPLYGLKRAGMYLRRRRKAASSASSWRSCGP